MSKKEPRRRRSVEQTIALIADLETKIERQARRKASGRSRAQSPRRGVRVRR
jgi:hypothetical protein